MTEGLEKRSCGTCLKLVFGTESHTQFVVDELGERPGCLGKGKNPILLAEDYRELRSNDCPNYRSN